MTNCRVHSSITTIHRQAWNACFPDELEDYDYYLAIEQAGISGFEWFYVTAEKDGVLIGALPGFYTEYSLDTTVQGTAKTIMQGIKRILPWIMVLRLACLGSPETESCVPGLHPSLDEDEKKQVIGAMMAAFEEAARTHHASLYAINDVPEKLRYLFDSYGGYCAISGLPTAMLRIDFTNVDDYIGRLSSGARKDMRRKLRSRKELRIEYRQNVDDMLAEIMTLYRQTKERSDWQFEELDAGYFSSVLSVMKERAMCILYYAGETLVAANLVLLDGHQMIDKFFCMNAELGRKHNLYFISWFVNLELCLERGISLFHTGQAAYENKVRLQCQLSGNWNYFRHRNRVIHKLLSICSPLFAVKVEKQSFETQRLPLNNMP